MSILLKLWLVGIVSALALAGCGAGDDSTPASSTPANSATNVGLLSSLDVTVAQKLDPVTVNGSTVTLFGRNNLTSRVFRAQGSVSYDPATGKVTFTLIQKLEPNCSYILKLSGFKDTDGNTVADKSVFFSTFIPQSSRAVWYAADGTMEQYATYLFDNSGTNTRSTIYNSPGSDNIWFTTDDQVASYFDAIYEPGGKKVVSHTNAGPDGIWFTADDPVDTYYVQRYSDTKDTAISYNGSGPDEIWFTADDTVARYTDTIYNPDGLVSKLVEYYNPGADGIWFSADDPYGAYSTFLYDADGNQIREAFSLGAGADGIPFTVDDENAWYYVKDFDANNNLIRKIYYQNPGPDGAWFTSDDEF